MSIKSLKVGVDIVKALPGNAHHFEYQNFSDAVKNCVNFLKMGLEEVKFAEEKVFDAVFKVMQILLKNSLRLIADVNLGIPQKIDASKQKWEAVLKTVTEILTKVLKMLLKK